MSTTKPKPAHPIIASVIVVAAVLTAFSFIDVTGFELILSVALAVAAYHVGIRLWLRKRSGHVNATNR